MIWVDFISSFRIGSPNFLEYSRKLFSNFYMDYLTGKIITDQSKVDSVEMCWLPDWEVSAKPT